jgi:RND family efflux transporter MFP subunit
MRKRLLFLITACVVLGLFAFLIVRSRRQGSVEAAPEPPAAQVSPAQIGSISHILTLAAQFQPYQIVDVHPKVSGFIEHIYVDIGDKVHAGETLAILEVPELAAQLKSTVAEVRKSQDDVTRAEHEVSRAEALYAAKHADNVRMQATAQAEPGLIAQQELDDTQAADLAAASEVDAAKAALAAARGGSAVADADSERVAAIQGYTNVVAPLDGVITWRYADTGALIQSGTGTNNQALPIVKLAQSGLLRLRMPIPEDAVRYVHIGDEMQIRVNDLDRSFVGKVVRFTRSVDFETRTMQTEVDVENKDLTLDPGMYANVNFILAHAENVLTIPVEALVLTGNPVVGHHYVVYTLDASNHVHIRQVDVGLQGSSLAQIKAGLATGDRVIVGGQAKYQDSEAVTPVLAPRPANDVTRMQGGTVDMTEDQGQED